MRKSDWENRTRGFSTGFYFHRPTHQDIVAHTSGNLATEKKVQIGKVIAYYRDVHAAKIELIAGRLKLGDEIYIEGGKLGTFCKQKITSMQIKKNQVMETPLASAKNPVLVGIEVKDPVKKGDWVYIYEKSQGPA